MSTEGSFPTIRVHFLRSRKARGEDSTAFQSVILAYLRGLLTNYFALTLPFLCLVLDIVHRRVYAFIHVESADIKNARWIGRILTISDSLKQRISSVEGKQKDE
ncbi:hypothetical protein R3P38DRAFT_2769949 [Favolaschia claudopus]|uniref:Uncharacterized protein n=1 Tax=Favolaschia claudopus TaxID=2862362 RepID=A0AAW0CLG3_9AGAR